MKKLGLFLVLTTAGAAGCGDDGGGGDAGGPPQPKAGQPGSAAKPAPKGTPPKLLVPKMKVEDRVPDPAERVSIRHTFKERDFAVEQSNRDPFQSFVINQPGLLSPDSKTPRDITKNCTREDQFVATNYSYTDLRLVGIVAERAQRRVLMMDSGNLGHIIKKGDCVGREKAVVKDIGAGYITFTVTPEEQTSSGQAKPVEEHSVKLYPNQVPISSQPTAEPTSKSAPVVAPPGGSPPAGPQIGPGANVPVESPPESK